MSDATHEDFMEIAAEIDALTSWLRLLGTNIDSRLHNIPTARETYAAAVLPVLLHRAMLTPGTQHGMTDEQMQHLTKQVWMIADTMILTDTANVDLASIHKEG